MSDTKKLRCGLEVKRAYAFGLDDGSCPCGLVIEADEDGVVVARFSWLTSEFWAGDVWIAYASIRQWLRAEKLDPSAKAGRGYGRDDRQVVFDMEPLGTFQTSWHQDHRDKADVDTCTHTTP